MKSTSLPSILMSILIMPLLCIGPRTSRSAVVDGAFKIECLVGIEVINTSTDRSVKSSRHGNGCMIRQDGFIILPTVLLSKQMRVAGSIETAGSQSINVFLNPGTSNETKYLAKSPHFESEHADYCVIRIHGWKGDSSKLYVDQPDIAADGTSLFQSKWNPNQNLWEPPAKQNCGVHKRIAASAANNHVVRELTEPISDCETGAVIVTNGGAIIGIVSRLERGTANSFEDFNYFNRVSNCVGVLQIPAESSGSSALNTDSRQMVKIPSGLVELPKCIIKAQPDLESETKALVAGFEIDKFKVTNRDYLKFWSSLPENDRKQLSFRLKYFPAAWSKAGPPFPSEIGDFPVLGVPLTGAQQYAQSQGKRLLTPYEWALAMLGPQGAVQLPEWTKEYVRDRNSVWETVSAAHRNYILSSNPAVRSALLREGSQLPWIGENAVCRDAYIWSRNTVQNITDQFYDKWLKPTQMRPVGSRGYDTSPFGIADALLNGPEVVTPYPGMPVRGRVRVLGFGEYAPAYSKNDEFTILPSKIIVGDGNGTYLPPLSRLYRRTILSPSTREILAWSNIGEAASLMAPIPGAGISYLAVDPITCIGFPRAQNDNQLLSSALDLWSQKPRHFEFEVGTSIPIETHETHLSTGPSLYYHFAYGFRCAR